ncbi:hypothetical protein [Paenibacillus nasutitermitis]|uniref:Uncharacterized protein n=1 Tax=Paenibacillus nasutitermitis TaxID=1652958 RepID=A0A916ZCW0_9BACL|nr:hypothetical protein [Paenibacillus nasutitermitis]GGD87853.1 hypothetical protein GCM10010911_52900 [Paenibacillus nasutitermitis]
MSQIRGTSPSARLFVGEKWLVLTGLLGFGLAGICAVWVLIYGGHTSPEGDVSKAISFDAALGIFLLSTAAVIPLSGMGAAGRAVFRWCYIALALFSYFAETVQNFRGVNPRFVKGGSQFDVTVGSVFAFVALLLVLFYLFLAIQYFRRKTRRLHPELVLGIRYAMLAVLLSFAAGIWISVNQGRFTGMAGNIIWLHGLGFHALQALPFTAWLTGRSSLTEIQRRRMIHTAGIGYFLGLAALGWQTYIGSSILELSVLPLLAFGCFLIALLPVAVLLLKAGSPARNERSHVQ